MFETHSLSVWAVELTDVFAFKIRWGGGGGGLVFEGVLVEKWLV
jgi:hypothetical protein